MAQKLSEKQLDLMRIARERRVAEKGVPVAGPTTLQRVASGLGAVGKEAAGVAASGIGQGAMLTAAIPREVSDIASQYISPFVARQLGMKLRPGTSLMEQAGLPSMAEMERGARRELPEVAREALFFEPETFPGRAAQRGIRSAVPALVGGPASAMVAAGAGAMGQTAEEALELAGVPEEQAQMAGTAVEVIADVFGVPRALASKVVKQGAGEVPTAAALQAKSRGLYQKARETGGVLSPAKRAEFLDDAAASVKPQTPEGMAIAGESPAVQILKGQDQFRGQPLTLEAATEIDQLLGKEATQYYINNPSAADDIMNMQSALRETLEKAAREGAVEGGEEGIKAYREATKLWHKQAKLRDVETIIENAMRKDNPATALRSGFDTLFRNKKRMRGFSEVERKAIERAATTGGMTDVLKTFGSRLLGIGGAVAGGPATAAGLATGAALARKGATTLQAQRAAQAREIVARGGPLAEFLQAQSGLGRAAASIPRAGVRALAGQRGLQAIPIAQQRAGVLGREVLERIRGGR